MYKEYKQLNLSQTGKEVLEFWKKNNIFEKSISNRPEDNPYTFYEGPPSANGMPGIHHAMARSIKDIFCRYKTLKGYQVKRKGGWDTHGLPIELAVEKALGITKDDIGKKITVKEYNDACRKEVMRYTDVWNDLTEKMGYWVDLEDPYITYKNEYIESLWWILKEFYKAGYLYKGYTIQPYSPKSGTGLSSHELNQPGTYKMVRDMSAFAMFKVVKDAKSNFLFEFDIDHSEDGREPEVFFIAWTTTPWTLPSNTALAVNKNVKYIRRYGRGNKTKEAYFIIAEDLADSISKEWLDDETKAPVFLGKDLEAVRYEQLMPYAKPDDGDAFKVITGDFVTTESGTGIVHIAPSFGADDFKVAKENGIGSLTLVDKRGRFTEEVTDFANEYVKEAYLTDEEKETERIKQGRDKYLSVDIRIAILLESQNRLFARVSYEHSYPHSWRSDEPILYYPLDSWFIKTTAVKDKMVALNKTINWKPESTGTGRFGNWLENLVDWNLSRSRYWGTPLPIWREENGGEEKCIGSIAELNAEIEKSIAAGFMPKGFGLEDMHRPYVDDVILTSSTGNKMFREPDLIDVWFDSGAMPYAQWHFPFENKDEFAKAYPADFIAEGVDQTRGWFFTLHAIAVMLSECSDEVKAVNQKVGNGGVAFKNVISNGLVLDKNGNKMSKRLGNGVDPFETIEQFGADAPRWYMISNASPWDNLKFNVEGIDEVRRKFFGTLYNTYSFFVLYANIDKFTYSEAEIEISKRPEIDRWIISLLNTLTKEVDGFYADFEPTKAARAIQEFVDAHFSNWFIRLSRRRFWRSDNSDDKLSAYQTLYTCLITISKLMSPIAPFFADRLYSDLNSVTGKEAYESVHLAYFPEYHANLVDTGLEERMKLAQDISSLVLSLRKKIGINVRQPLSKILIPSLNLDFEYQVSKVADLILSETNIKHLEFINDTSGVIKKKFKPNFKSLGKKVGKDMNLVVNQINQLTQDQINEIDASANRMFPFYPSNGVVQMIILDEDIDVVAEDVPGWQVANLGKLTVALDVTITDELKQEGIARELINRIQNLRKDKGFEVTDKIDVKLFDLPYISESVKNNLAYICAEVLAVGIVLDTQLNEGDLIAIDGHEILIVISKI